jgi:hypothetical protein
LLKSKGIWDKYFFLPPLSHKKKWVEADGRKAVRKECGAVKRAKIPARDL